MQSLSFSLSINGHASQVNGDTSYSRHRFFVLIIPHWRLDKIGRKPVVLAGTLGLAAGTIAMGFSNSLYGVLLARSIGLSLRLPRTVNTD